MALGDNHKTRADLLKYTRSIVSIAFSHILCLNNAGVMRFIQSLVVSVALLAGYVKAAIIAHPMEQRQTDCEEQYGTYPEYKGPCELTNCGVRGQNCRQTGWSGCVGYPSFVCPYKGCACTNY
ncbi:hypothetical protein BDV95DRAFT_152707 [Massariosphaeria phaeospora]|uniref:Uncharacterized protein n=1 Tax=Massariosphaeria phaeospora TaxID=100035 RepID=A0A7C8MHD8_9PLEO|nr:hypothetical protein BDV95DRAFT_152707 [Massariosphaeria phaeospora]